MRAPRKPGGIRIYDSVLQELALKARENTFREEWSRRGYTTEMSIRNVR